MRAAVGAALLAAAGLVVAGSELELTGLEKERVPGHHLLYLPSGKYLRIASLGYSSLAADVLYIWSIQYYSDFQIEDRYEYVEHIYSDIITELDPHYFDPYWIGALILSVETGNREKGIALLDKGFRNNPTEWLFLYLAGWECAYGKQFDRAADYFRRAAGVPGAPSDVGRLVAGMYQKAGDPATALAEWSRIARTSIDPDVQKVAEHQVRSLTIDNDLAALRSAIERYRAARGEWPKRLSDLLRERSLDTVPLTPDGNEYGYDPSRGEVSAGTQRVIPR